jgi:hypothetical protein
MNVFNVSDKIAVISDLMFPVTPLPDCLLIFIKMGSRLPPLEFLPALPAEMTLNLTPAHGEVAVICRQRPNAMQMLGQQNKSVDSKWVPLHNGPESFS